MNAQRLPSDWDGHQARSITGSREIQQLKDETTPIPGRPGWRVDEAGREWYSAAWLSAEREAI